MKWQVWRLKANCLDLPVDRFFEPSKYDYAKMICDTCPVRKECLAYAMDTEGGLSLHRRHGVYGGKTPSQRLAMRVKEHGSPTKREHDEFRTTKGHRGRLPTIVARPYEVPKWPSPAS